MPSPWRYVTDAPSELAITIHVTPSTVGNVIPSASFVFAASAGSPIVVELGKRPVPSFR